MGEEDIYVFFYNRENSNASLLLQAQTAVYYDSTANNVHMVEVGYSQELIDEWNAMRKKRKYREISYEEYIEWKLNFELEVDGNE